MILRRETRLVVLLCIAIAATVGATTTHAQIDFGTDFSLSSTPEHPAPGETVRISAKSLLLDIEKGELTWYLNGSKHASGTGVSEIETVAGPLGSVTNITATFSENGFERAAAEAVIRPVEVDLLWESDSYTPPFFRGRALPSAGTNLRMQAVPRFKRADGTFVPVSEIMFTWRRNNYVIAGVSGRGKNEVRISSPPLFGADTISVEAQTEDGLFAGGARVQIPSVEPILSLYESHPLFGIMYHRALGKENFFPETEVSFAAVPYFAQAESSNDKNLVYEWRVDGNVVEHDPARPSTITINASGSNGIALIGLALSHVANLFLNSSASWRITLLGDATPGGAGNPFGTAQ